MFIFFDTRTSPQTLALYQSVSLLEPLYLMKNRMQLSPCRIVSRIRNCKHCLLRMFRILSRREDGAFYCMISVLMNWVMIEWKPPNPFILSSVQFPGRKIFTWIPVKILNSWTGASQWHRKGFLKPLPGPQCTGSYISQWDQAPCNQNQTHRSNYLVWFW